MQREILFRGKRVDNGEWVEGYYAYDRVDAATYLGLTLRMTCLNEDYPSPTNLPIQYPTYNTLSFDNSTLCTDYVNKNYKHICIADRFYNDSRINRRWQENHYSNDITVTGNLIDNPQLLTPCP